MKGPRVRQPRLSPLSLLLGYGGGGGGRWAGALPIRLMRWMDGVEEKQMQPGTGRQVHSPSFAAECGADSRGGKAALGRGWVGTDLRAAAQPGEGA